MNMQFLKNYLQKMKLSGLERKIPNISEQNAEFIGKILSEKNPKNILEIGTANGYSALSFCYWMMKNAENSWKNFENSQNQAMKIWEKYCTAKNWENEIFTQNSFALNGETGKNKEKHLDTTDLEIRSLSQIFTIEYTWNAHIEAIEHFKNCKTKNIFPMWGDAKKIIPVFENNFFDVIYIDAMKKEYLDYLLLSLPKAKDNAIFIIDDVEKFAHKMQKFYDFLAEKNIKFTLHKTDEDDSIMIIERRNIVEKIFGKNESIV